MHIMKHHLFYMNNFNICKHHNSKRNYNGQKPTTKRQVRKIPSHLLPIVFGWEQTILQLHFQHTWIKSKKIIKPSIYKYLLALSAECTSEKITITRPAMQITTPTNFLNLYFVFKKNQVNNRTHGIDQQSSSMTLVMDVYWYAFTTVNSKYQTTLLEECTFANSKNNCFFHQFISSSSS